MRYIYYFIMCFSCLVVYPKPLKAQFVVIDPANLGQNVLTAIRTLQSNINEATMIANQVQQLVNDALNLEKLPYSLAEQYREQLFDLFEAMGRIHGLMQDFHNLEQNFERLYPDFLSHYQEISGTDKAYRASEWLRESRNSMKQAALTGSKILDDLPWVTGRVDGLLLSSEQAVGMMQATQAGNQLTAEVVGSLTTLNGLLAHYVQAHTAYLQKENSKSEAHTHKLRTITESYTPNTHPGVPLTKYY